MDEGSIGKFGGAHALHGRPQKQKKTAMDFEKEHHEYKIVKNWWRGVLPGSYINWPNNFKKLLEFYKL